MQTTKSEKEAMAIFMGDDNPSPRTGKAMNMDDLKNSPVEKNLGDQDVLHAGDTPGSSDEENDAKEVINKEQTMASGFNAEQQQMLKDINNRFDSLSEHQ